MSTQVTQPMAENAEHRREALFVRVIRRLADSRELTLFVLVVALVATRATISAPGPPLEQDRSGLNRKRFNPERESCSICLFRGRFTP